LSESSNSVFMMFSRITIRADCMDAYTNQLLIRGPNKCMCHLPLYSQGMKDR
jgi:hypothetical protein